MTNEKFSNSPLVEIVAEIRWGESIAAPKLRQLEGELGEAYDVSYDAFVKAMRPLGYRNIERLIPAGFPGFYGHPSMRCRPDPADDVAEESLLSSTLVQFGPGIFAVNGMQPYSSWDEFYPFVQNALVAFIDGCIIPPVVAETCDSVQVLVRYVDAFTEAFTEGRSAAQFMRDGLGIAIDVADVLQGEAGEAFDIPALSLVVPLEQGRMTLKFTDGQFRSNKALMLQMDFKRSELVAFNAEDVMQAFAQGRDAIHRAFVGMTRSIHEVMQPVEV